MKKIIIGVFILGIFIFAILAGQILHFGWTTKPLKSDCIIVLGCKVRGEEPSYFLKERLDLALSLYNEGYSKYIIVTGGQGENEDVSEAEAMKRYLIRYGVDKKFIIEEDKSYSTYENLFNSVDIMKNMGFNSAIIVSNKYHLKRASLIARKIGMNATYSGCYVKEWIWFETVGFLREIIALLKFYILGS
ncbi:vancomycin high temperature exclusion protein [Caloramator mitchellensis]|uniref:Vancomycin high temperature exclusion protein n=1 Tax=Caloramator mitchellensis TaxID=908809 RepID=A0A0R3JUC9_CALMK|nr:YdcF family protein [Caloramator mitchellensis]KRQ87112.1 vancomycin high temperature exclusion protein [Caloramator mitchellensis]